MEVLEVEVVVSGRVPVDADEEEDDAYESLRSLADAPKNDPLNGLIDGLSHEMLEDGD